MISDETMTKILKYLREHPEGSVQDLLNQEGINQDVIENLKVFVISVSDIHNRYRVHKLGKRYIDVVL